MGVRREIVGVDAELGFTGLQNIILLYLRILGPLGSSC